MDAADPGRFTGASIPRRPPARPPAPGGSDRVCLFSFIVDGGPKVASVVVDERLDDGGDEPQGWAFVPLPLGEVGGSELRLAPDFDGTLSRFLIFDRALLTTEAIATTRALLG